MKFATRKSLTLIAVSAAITTALAGCSAGSAGSTATSTTKYRFADTGTFNTADPQSTSITGTDLSGLGNAPKLGKDVKIGVLLKSLTNQYWQQVEAGIKQGQSDFDVQLSPIQSSQSETDTSQQLQICQSMLLNNYDAIILSPQTTANLNPCIAQLKAKNIPVINIAAPGDGLDTTVYVGPALASEGQLGGEYLAKTLAAGSEVAEIQGLPGASAADLRSSGFQSAVKGSSLKLVSTVAGDWDEQKAFNQTQSLLSKYPDLKGIYAANDTMATAVAKAATQADRKDLIVVGTDGVPQTMTSIRSGGVSATATPFPFYQGYWSLEAAVRLLGGQKVPLWVNTTDKVITKDNVDQYFDAQGQAKPGLFAAK